MSDYRPKRASKRWLEEAPEYVLACYDNGGKTCDRYTVLFGGTLWEPCMGRTMQALGLSEYPAGANGFCVWFELPAHCRPDSHTKIRWLDLPERVRASVIRRATET